MATTEKEKKEEAAPKKKGKGLLIGIIVAVILVLGGGGFFFMKGMSGGGSSDEAHATEGASKSGGHGGGHGAAPEKANGSLVSLDPFIVNLQDNSGTRYLKLNINLELASGSSDFELTELKPQIRDSLIILFSSKSYSDIGTVEGKYQLRDEIVARVNQFLGKSKVKTAFFTEFVIQ